MADEQNTDKSGAPQCGIYIRIDLPHGKMGEKDGDYSHIMLNTQLVMKTVNEQSAHEKNMHVVEISGGHPESLKVICQVIQSKGFVVIINQDHITAQKCGADGVILAQDADVIGIRKILGDDFIIGVKGKIHEAADYVTLPPIPQDIMAFTAKSDKLCVASGKVTRASISSLIHAGATFVDMTDYITGHKDGVVKATEKVMREIQKSEEEKESLN